MLTNVNAASGFTWERMGDVDQTLPQEVLAATLAISTLYLTLAYRATMCVYTELSADQFLWYLPWLLLAHLALERRPIHPLLFKLAQESINLWHLAYYGHGCYVPSSSYPLRL